MKKISRSLVILFALVLLLSVVPKADAQVAVLEPGETATFVLPFTGACAIEGEVEFSDKSMISDVQYDIIGDGMDGLVENGLIFLYADDPNGVDGKISITVTLSDKAAAGSVCTITIRYAVTAAGSNTPGGVQTVTHSVTVPVKETVPVETQPPETEPAPTKPTEPAVKYADTTALKEQIKKAQSLTYYNYTSKSWSAVETALDKALNLLGSTSQSEVDTATKNLKNAISNLVPMDYSALQEALDTVGNMENLDEVAQYWERFIAALADARAQLTGGDQDAVNAATEELLESWEELVKAMEDMGQIVEVEVEVEKIVEVEPSYDFCNIGSHKVFLIIMIVSLVINAILGTLIAIHFIKKHKKEHDDTPLVEYDIEDDMPEINEDLLE